MAITTFQVLVIIAWCIICPVKCISTPTSTTLTTERPADVVDVWAICSSVKDCGTKQQDSNIISLKENFRTELLHEDGIDVVALCKSVLICHLDKAMWWIINLNTDLVTQTNVCVIFDICRDILGIPIAKLSFRAILDAVPVLNITWPLMTNDTGLYLLPMDVIDLCPYTGYCGLNASRKLPDTSISSCCSECSCDRDCGLVNNCCYAELDIYNIFQCIETKSTPPLTILQSTKYSMVNRCLKNDGSADSKICTDTRIRPVSSTDTRVIYINSECALCNQVKQFRQWKAFIFCNETTTLTSLSNFQQKRMTACDYKYIPAEMDMDWADHYICDNKVIRTCAEGFANKHVETACQQLRAPYIIQLLSQTKTYANVYCALCSNRHSTPKKLPKQCYVRDGQPIRDFKFSGLFILMDSSVMDSTELNIKGKRQMSDDACRTYTVPYSTKPGCRPLLCPEGMVRIMGSCQHYAERWFNLKSSIQILLTPVAGTTVNTSVLTSSLAKSLEQGLILNKWIANECPLGYYFREVFETSFGVYMLSGKTENKDLVQQVVVKVFTEFVDVVPRDLINATNRCLLQQWNMSWDNIVYPFATRLYTYKHFIPTETVWQSEESNRSEINWPQDNKTYTLITPVRVSEDIHMYITKLYFCNQVELNADEITAYSHEIVIKHNGVVLGDNEYAQEQVDDDTNNFIVKVCVEDYMVGLNRNDAKSNAIQLVHLFTLVGALLVHLFETRIC